MFDTIFMPLKSIMAAKKKKNSTMTYGTLIVASVIAGLLGLIGTLISRSGAGTVILTFFVVAIAVFLVTLFVAWLYQIALTTLTKKVKYARALGALSKYLLVLSVALLLTMLLAMIPSVGLFIGGVLFAILFLVANVVLIRSTMEFCGTDLLTTIVSMFVVYTAVSLIAYFTLAQFAPSLIPLLSSLGSGATAGKLI